MDGDVWLGGEMIQPQDVAWWEQKIFFLVLIIRPRPTPGSHLDNDGLFQALPILMPV